MSRRDSSELESVNLLDLRPVHLAEWELQEVESPEGEARPRVVIERPRPGGRSPRHWVDWVSFFLSVRKIRLDELGSFSWQRLDGDHTVRQVAAQMRAELGDAAEPAEERLGHFVRQLRREKLLGYPTWDPGSDP